MKKTGVIFCFLSRYSFSYKQQNIFFTTYTTNDIPTRFFFAKTMLCYMLILGYVCTTCVTYAKKRTNMMEILNIE